MMSVDKNTAIQYEPIPSVSGPGYTALTIYPPRCFMPDDVSWGVFVGGCGTGHADTEAEARTLLLQRALRECGRRAAEAEAIVRHYRAQYERLKIVGLRKATVKR